MAVVHSFPSTSWLDATDGTSNSSSSQSPAPAASAQASTWHHDEERTSSAKKKKKKGEAGHKQFPEYGTTCETENKMQHNTGTRCRRAYIHSWMDWLLPSTLGDHREGAVEENNKRRLNYSEF